MGGRSTARLSTWSGLGGLVYVVDPSKGVEPDLGDGARIKEVSSCVKLLTRTADGQMEQERWSWSARSEPGSL